MEARRERACRGAASGSGVLFLCKLKTPEPPPPAPPACPALLCRKTCVAKILSSVCSLLFFSVLIILTIIFAFTIWWARIPLSGSEFLWILNEPFQGCGTWGIFLQEDSQLFGCCNVKAAMVAHVPPRTHPVSQATPPCLLGSLSLKALCDLAPEDGFSSCKRKGCEALPCLWVGFGGVGKRLHRAVTQKHGVPRGISRQPVRSSARSAANS